MYPLHLSIVSSTPSTILYPDTYFLDEEIDVLSRLLTTIIATRKN